MTFTREGLEQSGFAGFVRMEDLSDQLKQVPTSGGIYIVLRVGEATPVFLPTSGAGWYKGLDPTVSLDDLQRSWVDGAAVLYIGMSVNLRSRLRKAVQFGRGKPVAKRGGRLIWQLEGCWDLLAVWKETPAGQTPRQYEQTWIQAFEDVYHRLPFANRVH